MDYKLFVRNMATSVTEEQLQSTFAQFGEVSFCRICQDQDAGTSRGFGFVCFTSQDSASEAVAKLNGLELEGKQIEVKQVDSQPAVNSNPVFQMECYAFKKGACKFGSQCRFSHHVQPVAAAAAVATPVEEAQQQPEEEAQQQPEEEQTPMAVVVEQAPSVAATTAAPGGKKKKKLKD
ncbi:hypothetical protein BASA81_003010 [Batrachochytrium salamandrivorans]|nr:hypothetical protein BASA81_003010 [Batrachochytrium salamandrivorans]